MKAISFTATLIFQIIAIVLLKLLDNYSLIFAIILCCLVAGLVIKMYGKSYIKDLGWGLLYSSLFILISITSFLIWLSFHFPH
jgi:hypothetical protein